MTMLAAWWLLMCTGWLLWGGCAAGAYLVGATPFGVLIGRWRGVDIREHGSGNIGATNAGRVLGRRAGITCFVLDVAKGLLPVLAYGLVMGIIAGTAGAGGVEMAGVGGRLERGAAMLWRPGSEAAGVIAAVQWLGIGVAAIVGHMFPIYLKFRGGKGVATGAGVLLGMWPVLTGPVGLAAVLWFAVVKTTGYVSLASMTAAASLPITTFGSGWLLGLSGGELAVFVGAMAGLAGLVVLRHRGNLARLRAGTEAKVKWAGADG